MFNRFARGARAVVEDATGVAQDLGAPGVEAEHLLLAAARSDAPVARVLRDAGLDPAGLERALAAETARSLHAVGVTGDAPAFSPFPARPRFATSSKLALERSLRVTVARGDRAIEPGHVVLGVLRATVGTVPRALECAGVDRVGLMTEVERAL